MSHDKVVNFIDTHLRNTVSEDKQVDLEELIALHYQAVHNARVRGYKDAEKALPLEGSPPSVDETIDTPTALLVGVETALLVGIVIGLMTGLVVATLLA